MVPGVRVVQSIRPTIRYLYRHCCQLDREFHRQHRLFAAAGGTRRLRVHHLCGAAIVLHYLHIQESAGDEEQDHGRNQQYVQANIVSMKNIVKMGKMFFESQIGTNERWMRSFSFSFSVCVEKFSGLAKVVHYSMIYQSASNILSIRTINVHRKGIR